MADIGTQYTRIGYADNTKPDVIIRSLISGMKHSVWHADIEFNIDKTIFLIDNVISYFNVKGVVRYFPAIDRNLKMNVNFERFFSLLLTKLTRNMFNNTLIFSYNPLVSPDAKASITQIFMRESKQIFMIPHPILILYAIDKKTGLVIDSGAEYTSVYPVCEGKLISDGMKQTKVAGNLVNTYLKNLLKEKGYKFDPITFTHETFCEIKEIFCSVSQNGKVNNETIEIFVDIRGKCIKIQDEKFLAPEILFNPNLMSGNSEDPIPKLIIDAVNLSPISMKDDLLNNIVLCGGNTLLSGFTERLKFELQELLLSGTRFRILSPENRKLLAWIGGCKISKMDKEFLKQYELK